MDSILNICQKINKNIKNAEDDIQKIINLHKKIIMSTDKRFFENYGVYVDDIIFRKNFYNLDLKNLNELYQMLFKNLYGEIFKTYMKCIKMTASLADHQDKSNNTFNNESLSTNTNKGITLNPDIKPFKPFDRDIYSINDLRNLYTELCNLNKNIDDKLAQLIILIDNTNSRNLNNSIALQILSVSLNGEYSKFKADIDNIRKIFDFVLQSSIIKLQRIDIRLEEIFTEIAVSSDELESHLNNVTISEMIADKGR